MSLNTAQLEFLAAKGLTIAEVVELSRLGDTRKDPTAAERKRRQRERDRDMSHRDVTRDTPLSPSLDKENTPTPPKEINLSPLTPQTTLQNAQAGNDLDRLSVRLSDAVDGKIHPHAALVVGPMLELIAQGVDLETDIIPTLRARAAKMTGPANSWSYFVGAIRDAYNRRIEAGKGLLKPKEPVTLGQWEQGLPPDEQRVKWAKTLAMARSTGQWKTWLWGPKPGDPGCRVPEDLIAAERYLRPERLTEETKVPA